MTNGITQNNNNDGTIDSYADAKLYARFADVCYHVQGPNNLPSDVPEQWNYVEPLNNNIDSNGFQGCIFYNKDRNEYIVAFRGTEFKEEFFEDFVKTDCEGFGRDTIPDQFRDAYNLLKDAKSIRDTEIFDCIQKYILPESQKVRLLAFCFFIKTNSKKIKQKQTWKFRK